jgi:hypothetical protein
MLIANGMLPTPASDSQGYENRPKKASAYPYSGRGLAALTSSTYCNQERLFVIKAACIGSYTFPHLSSPLLLQRSLP